MNFASRSPTRFSQWSSEKKTLLCFQQKERKRNHPEIRHHILFFVTKPALRRTPVCDFLTPDTSCSLFWVFLFSFFAFFFYFWLMITKYFIESSFLLSLIVIKYFLGPFFFFCNFLELSSVWVKRCLCFLEKHLPDASLCQTLWQLMTSHGSLFSQNLESGKGKQMKHGQRNKCIKRISPIQGYNV